MEEKDFINIYNLYNKDIYRLSYSYTHNIKDAEDITQKVFIKYYKNLSKIKEEHIKQWLIKTTINECKDLFRNIWNKKVIKTDQEIIIKSVNNKEYLLENLPHKYRIIMHLFYYYGYTSKEISELTNIKESTIKQRLRRGRLLLKEENYE